MYQRLCSTPHSWRLQLLVVVLASAYSTAAGATVTGCKEIVPGEGCVAVSVSYRPTPLVENGEQWQNHCADKRQNRCEYGPVSIWFEFYDYERSNSPNSQDMGIRVQWSSGSPPGKIFHLQSELDNYCETHETSSEFVNLSPLQFSSRGKHLYLSLLDPVGECIVSENELVVPDNCYGIATGSQTQPSFESSGNLLNVTADEAVVVEGDEQMFWRVRWSWREDRPRNNEIETYHVRVQENGGGGDLRWLEVTGKMEVLLGNISTSSYTISIWRYECGCDINRPMGQITLNPLSPPSEVFTTSALVLPCPTPSSPSSQLHSSHSPSSPPPPSPSQASSSSPHLTPSAVHLPPSLTTLTTTPTPTQLISSRETTTGPNIDGKTLVIISVSVSTAVVLAVAILIAVTIIARRRCTRGDSNIEPADISITCPLSPEKLTALALYSIQTPEEDVKRLNELLVGGLADYNIRVVTPATTKPRDLQKEWIERGLRESHAVLLVCNRQFQEEWEGSGGEHGDLMVASVVKVMLGSLGDTDRSKIRCVYLREEDRVYSNPTLLLRHPISLADEEQGLNRIAKFVHDTPIYEGILDP